MAMTTGELDYDELYHQREGEQEIAFPPVSFIIWIIFLVLMPILLSNLLVSCSIIWKYTRKLSCTSGALMIRWFTSNLILFIASVCAMPHHVNSQTGTGRVIRYSYSVAIVPKTSLTLQLLYPPAST